MMDFRLGELFCGPGGIGYAAITAKTSNLDHKILHAWANDYDKDTCATFARNIAKKEDTVICQDIRKLDYSRLKKISEIDALAFGFPCNDFSVVGEQKGMDGVFGPLYSYGIRALEEFTPKWFLAENVGGLRNANDGGAFSKILNDMYSAGYSVYPHLYKFEEYGIPQSRHRIIIIGIRKDQDVIYKIPSTTPYRSKKRTCREAIEKPPIREDAPNNELTKQSKDVITRLKYIKPGENAFTANIPTKYQLNIAGAKISQIYKRLDPDKPAYTITGSGGGGTHVYHWKEDRALTNRERARLQTFPDDFIFVGSKESVRKQIGMAVPVDGVRIIFESILSSFAGIEYAYDNYSFYPLLQPEHIGLYNVQNPDQLCVCEQEVEYIAV
jgi:DNA (cytosine-5)-methyltransferase 1